MPLDDHEQRILAEIERHLYEDDPDLANAVKKIDRNRRLGLRLPVVGLAIGAVIILVSFTSNTLVALAGFALMVVSPAKICSTDSGISGATGGAETRLARVTFPSGGTSRGHPFRRGYRRRRTTGRLHRS